MGALGDALERLLPFLTFVVVFTAGWFWFVQPRFDAYLRARTEAAALEERARTMQQASESGQLAPPADLERAQREFEARVSADDKVADSGNSLAARGFRQGDVVQISGSGGGTNDGYFTVLSVQTDGSYMILSNVVGNESANAALNIRNFGKSLSDILYDGCFRLYDGSQPSSPDDVEDGDMIVEVSLGSATFVPGAVSAACYGLAFDPTAVAAGVLAKAAAETWSGVIALTGDVAWGRFYDSIRKTGAISAGDLTSYPGIGVRFDFSVGTTNNSDLVLAGTNRLVAAATHTQSTFQLTIPQYAT